MGLFPPAPGGGLGVGRGYKGKGILLHLLVDRNGKPLAISTTSANGDERKEVAKLLDRSKIEKYSDQLCERSMIILEGDKGYDASWLRQLLLKRGLFPFIPRRRMGKSDIDRPKQKDVANFFNIKTVRWVVERTFAWLKRKFRRLMLRWERLPSAWDAFVNLSLIHFWQQILVR